MGKQVLDSLVEALGLLAAVPGEGPMEGLLQENGERLPPPPT
ncbi:hypothetical protein [Streptomyces sp. NPDC017991]